MKRSPWFTAALILVLAVLACTIPGASGGDADVVATQVALGIQQTSVANQQMTLAAPTFPPPAETYTPYPTYTLLLKHPHIYSAFPIHKFFILKPECNFAFTGFGFVRSVDEVASHFEGKIMADAARR